MCLPSADAVDVTFASSDHIRRILQGRAVPGTTYCEYPWRSRLVAGDRREDLVDRHVEHHLKSSFRWRVALQ
jgi:hypothetical protein